MLKKLTKPSGQLLLQYSPDSIKSYLNEAQFKIYELIWRRTLASQMSKAEFLTTTVEVSVDNFIFTVSGQVTKFDGFTKLYNENKDGEINLPSFKLKDSLSIKNIYRFSTFYSGSAKVFRGTSC